MVIYKTTNIINGKIYVGKDSRNLESYLGSGELLKKAIKKYGKENFTKEILEICENLIELDIREKFWINKLDSVNNGYNLTDGGTGGDTFTKHPNKEKIREKLKKRVFSEKIKSKRLLNLIPYQKGNNHPNYGKKQTEETKEKRKETLKKNGITSPMSGKKHTEESKEKNRQKHLGKKVSKDIVEKIREKNKGKKRKIVKCPFCGKEGGEPAMIRWHFNNCNIKNENNANFNNF